MATRCTHLDQVIRFYEPGEDWAWCYPDQLALTSSTIDSALEKANEAAAEPDGGPS